MAPVGQRLFLARHAETITVTGDGRLQSAGMVPLTERGRRQADSLGRAFAAARLRRVHSSTQARAMETAQRLAGAQAELLTHRELEEISLGKAEGAPARDAFAGRPGYLSDPDVCLEGGETPRQVEARVGPAIEEILRTEADAGQAVVAVVGHGCVNRMVLAHLLGLDLRRALRIRQDWSGVNVLERRRGRWEIGALNWNPGGLPEFARTRGMAGVAAEVWERLGR
jgi:broad specificity phosphatase PhoE